MSEVTYGRLDQVLRSLGFSVREVDKAWVYEHERTGALVAIPRFPADQKVLPRHLDAVRVTLDNFEVADPMRLEEELQKAS